MTAEDLRTVTAAPGLPPLTAAQEEMWGAAVGDLSTVGLRLTGPLDETALERALDLLVARHEGLRCTVRVSGRGRPELALSHTPRTALVRSGPVDPGRLADAARTLVATAGPDAEPGLRAALVRQSAGEHLLLLAAHPLWVDEWSWQILLRELGEAYTAETGGPPPGPAPTGIREAVRMLGRRQAEGRWDAHTAHWRQRLDGSPTGLAFPVPAPADAGAPGHSAVVERRIARPVADAFTALGKALGTADWLNLLVLLAWTTGTQLGTDRTIVGVPAAGTRLLPGLQDTVGRLNGMLPVPFPLTPGTGFAAAALAANEAAKQDFAHQELPYRLALGTGGHRAPAAFSMRYPLHRPPGFRGLDAEPVPLDDAPAPYDLWMRATADDDGLRLAWCYDPAALDTATVTAMADAYTRLAEDVTRQPDTPLDILTGAAFGRRRAPGPAPAVRTALARIRTGAPTVVIAPGLDGSPDAGDSLAAQLPPEFQVMELRLAGPPGRDVTRLAAESLRSLPRSVLTAATLFAGRGCAGLVAQEMARLAASGTRELAPVAVIDTEPFQPPAPGRETLLRRYAAELGAPPPWTARDLAEQDETALLRMLADALGDGAPTPASLADGLSRFTENHTVCAGHRPVHHGGPLHVLMTGGNPASASWRPLTDRLYIHLVGRDRQLAPPARRVADILAQIALEHWHTTTGRIGA